MAKTGAQRQAAYRQRQVEEITQLRAEIAYLRPLIEEIHRHVTKPLSSRNGANPKTQQPKRERAFRLPEDWTLPDDWKEDASKHGVNSEIEGEKFANYYKACSAAKLKINYRAAWRNWCITAAEHTNRQGDLLNGQGRPLSPVDKLYLGAQRAADAWAERERTRLQANGALLDC